jgi:hypothetical protein
MTHQQRGFAKDLYQLCFNGTETLDGQEFCQGLARDDNEIHVPPEGLTVQTVRLAQNPLDAVSVDCGAKALGY